MSRENIEVVRRVLETPMKPDFSDAELEPLFHKDVQLDLTVRGLNPATYEGYAGVRRFVRDLYEIWVEWSAKPPFEFLPAGGDRVVGIYALSGRGRSSGVVVEMPVYNVFTVREGRVVRMKSYRDRPSALEVVGLAL
jgi:ketosteroid isomerase-like protein